ncbi:MAG: NADH-quinone oxidoreductase subunit N [Acidobacteria bacterium]|nr:NADH-quinone oxidoreductase subunit N [Acidobacteriota bacterium]
MPSLPLTPDLWAIFPELLLSIYAFIILGVAVFLPRSEARYLGYLSILGVALVSLPLMRFARILAESAGGVVVGWGGMFVLDTFALFFKFLFLLVAALTMLMSIRYLEIEGAQAGEYYALIMFAVVGMMFMASGRDLLMIFIGLETMSLSTYVLAGFLKRDRRSNEAALKYFLLGTFSTGLFLYGISLLYAVTGSTSLSAIATALAFEGMRQQPLMVLGLILLVVALGFKIAAVPFHMWVPDAYEGAPTAVAAFFSTGIKAAAFSIVLRILVEGMMEARQHWALLLVVLSAASMTIGNLGALLQDNMKRLLAYSSVAHAGYVLMGVLAAQKMGETGRYGLTAVCVYLLAYTFTNMGAFGLVVNLRREGLVGDQVDDFTGLARRAPFAAFAMLVFMLSLAGIPATAGFVGKWYLFGAAIKADYAWLAVLAVVNSAISLYFYLRVVVRMYMGDPAGTEVRGPSGALAVALAICLLFTFWIGIYPQPFLQRLAGWAVLQ